MPGVKGRKGAGVARLGTDSPVCGSLIDTWAFAELQNRKKRGKRAWVISFFSGSPSCSYISLSLNAPGPCLLKELTGV